MSFGPCNYLKYNSTFKPVRTPLLILLLCALCIPIFPHTAYTMGGSSSGDAERVTAIDTMTVTAERFPVEERTSSRFVTVISSEELKESGADNILDALRRAGGFDYKAFSPLGVSHGGMNSALSIRGVKDGELILINGVPIQGAAGHAYDLNTIPVDQIEKIEIMKGAASTMYGADAMSGVINIITKRAGKKKSAKASAQFGNKSYQNHSASASASGVNLGFNYRHLGDLTAISRSYSKKYTYDMDQSEGYSFNLNADPLENIHFDYIGSFNNTGFKKVYDDQTKAFEGTDQDQVKHFADLRYEADNLKLKLFGNYDIMRRSPYTTTDPDDDNRNYNSGVEGDYRFSMADWQLTTGTSIIHRGADYSNQYGEHHRNDIALYMEAKKALFEKLTLTAGAREQFIKGESGTSDYDSFLPSLGLSYRLTEETSLFANTGKAFRAPTFNNLYYNSSFLVGNPDLEPEEGWTYETGVKYDIAALKVRVAAFHMAYDQKIEVDKSKGYPQTYFNAGDYNSTGIEWELGISPFLSSTGWAGELYLYTAGYWADPTAEDTEGVEYQSGAKFQNSVGISHITDALSLDLNCRMVSSRERNLQSYAALNFYGKIRLPKGYLTFGADNIFDRDIEVTGDLSDTASNLYYYEDLGRLLKVGYEINF